MSLDCRLYLRRGTLEGALAAAQAGVVQLGQFSAARERGARGDGAVRGF